jgi:serine/threonine protein kinase
MDEYVLERRASWFKKWSPRKLEETEAPGPPPPEAKPSPKEGRYQFHKVLSRGGDGLLWIVHDTGPSLGRGETAAAPLVRVMKRRSFETLEQANEALQEAFIMSRIQSSCCLSLLDVMALPALSAGSPRETPSPRGGEWVLCMIFPYMAGGDLCDAMYARANTLGAPAAAPPGATWSVQRMVRDILQGLVDIHAAGVIHGDLKLENILLDEAGHCKICDFGVAVHGPHRTTQCGSSVYMAPEMVTKSTPYTAAIDIWACGLILLQLYSGVTIPPLEPMTAAERLLQGEEIPWPTQQDTSIGPGMLALDPAERPSAKQCLAMVKRWTRGSSPRTPTESPRQNQVE